MGLETAAIIAAVAAAAPAIYGIGKDIFGPGTSNVDAAGADKIRAMQQAGLAYGAYRPDQADARMKAMTQQLSAYKGAGNMLSSMYGGPAGGGGGTYTPGGGGFKPVSLPPPADRVPEGPLVPRVPIPQPPPDSHPLPPPADRVPDGPLVPKPPIPPPLPPDTVPIPPPADRVPDGPLTPRPPPPPELPPDTSTPLPPADQIPPGPIVVHPPDPPPDTSTPVGGIGRLPGGPIGRVPIGDTTPPVGTSTPVGPVIPPFYEPPQGIMAAPQTDFLTQLARSLAKGGKGTGTSTMASMLSKKV